MSQNCPGRQCIRVFTGRMMGLDEGGKNCVHDEDKSVQTSEVGVVRVVIVSSP